MWVFRDLCFVPSHSHFFQSSSLLLCSHASHLPSQPSFCNFLYALSHFLTFLITCSLHFIFPPPTPPHLFFSSCVQNRRQTCWLRRPRLQRRRQSFWLRKPPRPRRRCNALKWRPSAARRSDGSWSRRCWRRRYWLWRWQRIQKGGMEMRIESGWASIHPSIHLVINDSCQKQGLKLCQPSHESLGPKILPYFSCVSGDAQTPGWTCSATVSLL